MNTISAELSQFLARVLLHCLDIRAVWSVGHAEVGVKARRDLHELLVFANAQTLHILRRTDHLHRADVQVLVVFDGEQFESAWGACRLSGSLARWAWRQVAPDVAYYDESKWASRADEANALVRVRRKALLIWQVAGSQRAHRAC
jgi:hypothetical protein